MNENLAKYRRSLKISQTQMANIADMCLTSYRYKEDGKKPFNQDEMIKIYNFLIDKYPNITIEELFFNNKVIDLITCNNIN